MNLFRKKCTYCRKKIEKGKEVFRDVKDPTFIGTKKKAFCCSEHADNYKKDLEEYLEKPRSGGSCCG